MRVAFVFDEAAQNGGVFQHSLSTVLALQALRAHEIVVLTNRPENLALMRAKGVVCHSYRFGRLRRTVSLAVNRHRHLRMMFQLLPRSLQRSLGSFDGILDQHGVDVVICFSWVPMYLHHHPFIATVYDLCHREHCEFPEVSESYNFETREAYFREILPRALAVLVSSPSLGRSVGRIYGVEQSRLTVLPFLPALQCRSPADPEDVARVALKYSLPADYVFYPAQFWPHKNHVYLLEALKALETSDGIAMHAVFSGSDLGNKKYIRQVAERLEISDRVHFLGFVNSADMSALYTGARALVMPTYFGPTNIPPLEALAIGCPVIYSDLPEFREEMGDAVLYCDLRDPASLAAQIKAIFSQTDIVDALRRAGAAFAERTVPGIYVERLQALLDEFDYVRRRWTATQSYDLTN
jgi:glycosyltransferase involved in cell wall biosynthesis